MGFYLEELLGISKAIWALRWSFNLDPDPKPEFRSLQSIVTINRDGVS